MRDDKLPTVKGEKFRYVGTVFEFIEKRCEANELEVYVFKSETRELKYPVLRLLNDLIGGKIVRDRKTRVRDSQRSKLYAAEKVFSDHGGNMTLEGVEALVWSIMGSEWFKIRFGVPRTVKIKNKRGGWGGANCKQHSESRFTMAFHRFACKKWIVLHELAHGLVPDKLPAHGPEFAGVFLELVQQWMGEADYVKLRDSFKKHKVAWVPRSRATAIYIPRY
jgi:putative metallohydrolase (TIGR04338 family)